jgi:hypothetical protein
MFGLGTNKKTEERRYEADNGELYVKIRLSSVKTVLDSTCEEAYGGEHQAAYDRTFSCFPVQFHI